MAPRSPSPFAMSSPLRFERRYKEVSSIHPAAQSATNSP